MTSPLLKLSVFAGTFNILLNTVQKIIHLTQDIKGYTAAMYSLSELCGLFLLILIVVYWWRSRESHSVALLSARKYCQERNIQLLDDTLIFKKFTFAKAGNNRKYFSRMYSFDFCGDGTDRHQGEIILRGNSVLRVVLDSGELEITEY